MKLNFTPFVDLFSILAIGLLLIMTMTSGTDSPQTESRLSTTIIRFYLRVPVPMATIARVRPYCLRAGVEVACSDMQASVVANFSAPDYIELLIRGAEADGNLAVGFRVVEVVDADEIYEMFDTWIVSAGAVSMELACRQRMGFWRDPVVCLDGGQSCTSCGE